jgi:uncharacterized protein YeaO (DUF488 family)
MAKQTINIRRVYDEPAKDGGVRFLVDRIWPRGVKKETLHLDGWLKDVAPTDELRHWFGHDAAHWAEFRRRYQAELDANPSAWRPIIDAAQKGTVTLLFGARDEEHNQAVVLRDYLTSKLKYH